MFINSYLVQALQWWMMDTNLSVGRPFMFPSHTVTVTMDARMEGWGGHTQGLGLHSALFHRFWDPEEMLFHINVLELWVIPLMLANLGRLCVAR